jgi:hypothetical protein
LTSQTINAFCERCGTRTVPEEAASPLGGLFGRVRSLTARSADAGQDSLNLCLSCRGYVCGECLNDLAGLCLDCAPPVAVDAAAWPAAERPALMAVADVAPEQAIAADPAEDRELAAAAELEPAGPELDPIPGLLADLDARTAPSLTPLTADPQAQAGVEPVAEVEPVAAIEPVAEIESVAAIEPEVEAVVAPPVPESIELSPPPPPAAARPRPEAQPRVVAPRPVAPQRIVLPRPPVSPSPPAVPPAVPVAPPAQVGGTRDPLDLAALAQALAPGSAAEPSPPPSTIASPEPAAAQASLHTTEPAPPQGPMPAVAFDARPDESASPDPRAELASRLIDAPAMSPAASRLSAMRALAARAKSAPPTVPMLTPAAPAPSSISGRPVTTAPPGARACHQCDLPISVRASFCRRCGSSQPRVA